MMQIGRFNNLADGRVTNAACGIVDNATQRLLIVRVGHDTEVGNNILDFLSLIERQSAIDAIWDSVLPHLFLKRTALCISTIEDGEVTIVAPLLSTNPLDIVTHDDGFLLVAVGWFQSKAFALLVFAEHVLSYLPFILANQRVSSFYDKLCRTVVLFKFKETRTLRILLLEVENVIDIGPAERIDTLCIVTNHTDAPMLLCKL